MLRDTPVTPYTRLPVSTAIFANIQSAIPAMFTTSAISVAISAISVLLSATSAISTISILISATSAISAIFVISKISAIPALSTC